MLTYKDYLNSVTTIDLRLLFNCGSMEEEAHSVPVNTRISTGLIQEIDELVDKHQFRSRGDFVLSAVRHYLDHIAVDRKYIKLEPAGQPSFEDLARSAKEKP